MVSRPHGGRLISRVASESRRERILAEVSEFQTIKIKRAQQGGQGAPSKEGSLCQSPFGSEWSCGYSFICIALPLNQGLRPPAHRGLR